MSNENGQGVSHSTIKLMIGIILFLVTIAGVVGSHHTHSYRTGQLERREEREEKKVSDLTTRLIAIESDFKAFAEKPRYTAEQGSAHVATLREEMFRELARSTVWQKEQTAFTKEMIKFTATQEAANKSQKESNAEVKAILLELQKKIAN